MPRLFSNYSPITLILLLIYSPLSQAQDYQDYDYDLPNVVQPNNDYAPINLPGIEQTPYTLDAGDVIALDILNIPEYSKTHQVLIDGTINLPLINKIPVAGLTPSETQQLITQIYSERKLLVSPIITVNLVSPRPINVAIVGDVRNPGSYVIPFRRSSVERTEAKAVQFPSLIDALKIAQGINASADDEKIKVIRSYKDKKRIYLINLRQFLTKGDLTQDIVLRDGDRIVVPSAEYINIEAVRQRATADFSANLNVPISINIVGEVNRPGPYTLNAEEVKSEDLTDQLKVDNTSQTEDSTSQPNKSPTFSTLTTAIRFAGGLTGKADIRNIEVRRTLHSGEKQTITANLWELLQTGDFNQDLLLQEGDMIVIPTAQTIDVEESIQVGAASFSPNSINVNILGEVKKPGVQQLSPNTTLQQAILAAGGFNHVRATKNEVELIRLNPNGTVIRSSIKVNFAAEINESNENPYLLNNDIIVVKRNSLSRAGDFVSTLSDPIGKALQFVTPLILLLRR